MQQIKLNFYAHHKTSEARTDEHSLNGGAYNDDYCRIQYYVYKNEKELQLQ